jgi:hypothetical protein
MPAWTTKTSTPLDGELDANEEPAWDEAEAPELEWDESEAQSVIRDLGVTSAL